MANCLGSWGFGRGSLDALCRRCQHGSVALLTRSCATEVGARMNRAGKTMLAKELSCSASALSC